MKLLDQVYLELIAGNGGSGKTSFFQDWQQPHPRPDGGNGGNGAAIIFVADRNVNTLQFPHNRIIAESGQNGTSKKKHGRNGTDLLFKVPIGTLLWTKDKQFLLCNFVTDQQQFVAAQGGIGGRGNAAFLSTANRWPSAQPGSLGEIKTVFLELKMLAHVGLFGLPNAGKSSLLQALTMAKPKIANYSFTTLKPNLGVFDRQIIISDLPGIISGASENRGLGNQFLKHIERCVFLIYVVDLSNNLTTLMANFTLLITELVQYNQHFAKIPIIVALNKIDLTSSQTNQAKFTSFIQQNYPQFPLVAISALNRLNLEQLNQQIITFYEKYADYPTVLAKSLVSFPVQKLYEYKLNQELRLQKLQANTWVLSGKLLNHLIKHADLSQPHSFNQLNQQLVQRGVDQLLKAQKVKNGDVIIIDGQTFTWKYAT